MKRGLSGSPSLASIIIVHNYSFSLLFLAIVATAIHDAIIFSCWIVVTHDTVAVGTHIPSTIATTANSWIFVFIIPIIARGRGWWAITTCWFIGCHIPSIWNGPKRMANDFYDIEGCSDVKGPLADGPRCVRVHYSKDSQGSSDSTDTNESDNANDATAYYK